MGPLWDSINALTLNLHWVILSFKKARRFLSKITQARLERQDSPLLLDSAFNGVNIPPKISNDEYNVIKGGKGGGFGTIFPANDFILHLNGW